MPIINVSLRKGTTVEYRRGIADSIHRAMHETLQTPEDDYFQITHELDPENLIFDPNYFGVARSEKFVIVQLFFNARLAVVKERLMQKIADNLVASPGLRAEDIMINIAEVAPETWWLAGREIDPATGTDARMS